MVFACMLHDIFWTGFRWYFWWKGYISSWLTQSRLKIKKRTIILTSAIYRIEIELVICFIRYYSTIVTVEISIILLKWLLSLYHVIPISFRCLFSNKLSWNDILFKIWDSEKDFHTVILNIYVHSKCPNYQI